MVYAIHFPSGENPTVPHPSRPAALRSRPRAERSDNHTPDGPANAWVMATNVYHRTAQGWRMVAHHASPGTTSEIQEVSDAPSVLH